MINLQKQHNYLLGQSSNFHFIYLFISSLDHIHDADQMPIYFNILSNVKEILKKSLKIGWVLNSSSSYFRVNTVYYTQCKLTGKNSPYNVRCIHSLDLVAKNYTCHCTEYREHEEVVHVLQHFLLIHLVLYSNHSPPLFHHLAFQKRTYGQTHCRLHIDYLYINTNLHLVTA